MSPERLRFSVLMAVHAGERPAHLGQCLESLAAQTQPAEEILIVRDGRLGEPLERALRAWEKRLPITTLDLGRRETLGEALRRGVRRCRFDLIARMDSDDISLPWRFELQMRFLEKHPEIDIVGGQISEFDSDPATGRVERRLPEDHASILLMAEWRNPMNHMTVVFRRLAVLAAGNYRLIDGFEDYDLWVRMLCRGSRFHNLKEVVVLARCGSGMQQRRGGWDYLKREASLFWTFREYGFLSTGKALRNIVGRAPVRLMPVCLRRQVYHTFLRRHIDASPSGNPPDARVVAIRTGSIESLPLEKPVASEQHSRAHESNFVQSQDESWRANGT